MRSESRCQSMAYATRTGMMRCRREAAHAGRHSETRPFWLAFVLGLTWTSKAS